MKKDMMQNTENNEWEKKKYLKSQQNEDRIIEKNRENIVPYKPVAISVRFHCFSVSGFRLPEKQQPLRWRHFFPHSTAAPSKVLTTNYRSHFV